MNLDTYQCNANAFSWTCTRSKTCLCCPKEHLLEVWQIIAHVNSMSKKPIGENTIVPQDS